VLGAAHPEEFSFKPLVRLLEQGKDDSPCHPVEANPEVLPRVFGLKEMEENVYGGGMAKMVTEKGDSPDEGPAIRMQLGRGDVYFG